MLLLLLGLLTLLLLLCLLMWMPDRECSCCLTSNNWDLLSLVMGLFWLLMLWSCLAILLRCGHSYCWCFFYMLHNVYQVLMHLVLIPRRRKETT